MEMRTQILLKGALNWNLTMKRGVLNLPIQIFMSHRVQPNNSALILNCKEISELTDENLRNKQIDKGHIKTSKETNVNP